MREMRRKLPLLSPYRRERLMRAVWGMARFAITVLCSSLVTVWILDPSRLGLPFNHASVRSLWRRPLSTRTGAITTASPVAVSPPLPPKGNFGERYARYFDEAMPLLRSDAKVRMMSLEMASGVLAYQQNTAAHSAGYRLSTVSSRIPLIAVSRNSREFLATMRITFIDPHALPEELTRNAALPVSWEKIEGGYVLVPDLSGPHARNFLFTRR